MTDPSPYERALRHLRENPRRWLVTGAAGFIGSHLLRHLLENGQFVVGLDNLTTGSEANLDDIRDAVGPATWRHFCFHQGDIRSIEACHKAVEGVDFVLHHAALGSVPWSLEDPRGTNESNVDGFLNVLVASRDAGVRRLVYASSSAVYGDQTLLPSVEENIGEPLSPYAVTKYVNEMYARIFFRCYGFQTIGLRYFNIFGPRQDPNGPYAAVIPKWIGALLSGQPITIFGDGSTIRDYVFVENAVQANILAATTESPNAGNRVYNVAVGERTSLNELFDLIQATVRSHYPSAGGTTPTYLPFRPGDIRESQADISKACDLLGYRPTHRVHDGLQETVAWYFRSRGRSIHPR